MSDDKTQNLAHAYYKACLERDAAREVAAALAEALREWVEAGQDLTLQGIELLEARSRAALQRFDGQETP